MDDAMGAREYLDSLRSRLNLPSLYALAKVAELPPGYIQRYYRNNRIPAPARKAIERAVNANA